MPDERTTRAALRREGVVTVALETISEFWPAARHDAALSENVHVVGFQVGKDPAVVRDDEHAEMVFVGGTASCNVSLRFFSPPEKSTLTER